MSYHGRGVIIDRAFLLIKALISKPHTSQEMATLLGVSRSSAYYYIREASVLFPVIEVNGETKTRNEPILYYLPPIDLFGKKFLTNLKNHIES